MILNRITPVILSYNEEANLERTLAALTWAPEVIVIDSFSTDRTLEVCTEYDNVNIIQNAFVSHAEQSNFALSKVRNSEWVLSMDADYIVTPELRQELTELVTNDQINGYEINFKYAIRGHLLRGSLYPARVSLYRKKFAHYIQDGHTQRVNIEGQVSELKSVMHHDDRKSYSRWLNSQKKYAAQEAQKMAQTPWKELSNADKIRAFGLGPLVILPYTLFAKGLIINGMAGLEYSLQRFVAEVYLLRARIAWRLFRK